MELNINHEKYELKLAKTEDLNQVLQLLVNAAEWLQMKGTTQWDYYITDLDGNSQEVLDSIEGGDTYLLEKEGVAVASITLENKPNEWDRDIWGSEADQENILYLHRLVVHRHYKGKEIGEALLEWAEDFAKSRGIQCIRFDCLASNVGLNRYYQKRYKKKGIANIYGQHSKYEILG